MLLSTHQTEDVAALCRRVVVMRDGEARRSTGTPRELAELARGRVWLSDDARRRRASCRGAPATGATATSATRRRRAPSSSTPTLEDGYLLLVGRESLAEAA